MGEHFGQGVLVSTCRWADGHAEHVWGADVEEFKPERWLVGDVKELARLKDASQPFLRGPTSCPGKAMAMTEMMIIVARTLYRFDVRRVPSSDETQEAEIYKMLEYLMGYKEGPVVQFRTRDISTVRIKG